MSGSLSCAYLLFVCVQLIILLNCMIIIVCVIQSIICYHSYIIASKSEYDFYALP